MGLSEIILKEKEEALTPKKITILSSIRETSQLTYQLLENLLDWALSETNSIKFEPEILNLYQIVEVVAM